ncbi:hypothetical protein [Vaccinia virus Lister]|uniref:Uncharacterized protein n=1 Tax=Vaccinia virus TaxID=10245 RepID=A0A0M3UMI9_VACCV|nr:hypothetical protein VACV_IOC_B141_002 [Vaccinia virus]WPR21477.1 hypothetical protein [Vaccinia virus Lister]ALF05224.1 hypothetical protein VACV_IOC_B141_254 [Vaccinia virus]ALF05226.1 hypothetical protein VACV_IOC_B388_002 [Vaccinia virus]ALF05469.1 hypothetical protein VACV_IOC_B388_254 [Vaccinia virus]
MSRVNRTIQAHHELKKCTGHYIPVCKTKMFLTTFTKSYLSRLLLFLSQ